MGSLNSRWYVKFVAAAKRTSTTGSRSAAPTTAPKPPTSASAPLAWRCGSAPNSSRELNAGDETPGAVNYGTWWSPCDEIINPDSSVALSGATNTKTACISHVGPDDATATVYEQVREFVK